jgi:hypothetical protein
MRVAKDVFKIAIGLSVLLLTQVVYAQTACVAPDAPTIPDGSTASEQELVATVGAFKAYQAELAVYRDCLTTYEDDLGDDITDDQKNKMITDYNGSVDSEETLAVQLNEAIAAFRAANGG